MSAINYAHECTNDCGRLVECNLGGCPEPGDHSCVACEASELPPLSPEDAVTEIAELVFKLSKECGLPIVLDWEDRKALESILRRVR